MPVPGTPVGIELGIRDLGQDPVRLLPVLRRRRPVGRRTSQRMAASHPGAELGQAGVDGGGRRAGTDPEPVGCSPHQRRIAGRVGRREQ